MRAEIQKRQQSGLDFIKVYTRRSREAFDAAADETKRLGIPDRACPARDYGGLRVRRGHEEYQTFVSTSHGVCGGRR